MLTVLVFVVLSAALAGTVRVLVVLSAAVTGVIVLVLVVTVVPLVALNVSNLQLEEPTGTLVTPKRPEASELSVIVAVKLPGSPVPACQTLTLSVVPVTLNLIVYFVPKDEVNVAEVSTVNVPATFLPIVTLPEVLPISA